MSERNKWVANLADLDSRGHERLVLYVFDIQQELPGRQHEHRDFTAGDNFHLIDRNRVLGFVEPPRPDQTARC